MEMIPSTGSRAYPLAVCTEVLSGTELTAVAGGGEISDFAIRGFNFGFATGTVAGAALTGATIGATRGGIIGASLGLAFGAGWGIGRKIRRKFLNRH